MEDYEVLTILGSDVHSSNYKVRNKKTLEIYAWRAISIDSLNEEENNVLLAYIEERKHQIHPNLLKIYDYIVYERSVIYLVTEYCENESLYKLIKKCLLKSEYLDEDFILHLIHKLATTVKFFNIKHKLNIKNVFVDQNYTVKLLNFNYNEEESLVLNDIGRIMFFLLTLQTNFNETTFGEVPNYYSKHFEDILSHIKESQNANMDVILCHPLILLRVAQPIDTIFVKHFHTQSEKLIATLESKTHSETETYLQLHIQNIHKRELKLKMNEEKLKQKEFDLHKREKKIALAERLIKEKMTRAELYLRKSKDCKIKTKPTYEKLDTSFSADCGDSVIITTSKKIDDIIPPKFHRTFSERRIKFKGHSPLKEINYNYNNIRRLHNKDTKEYLTSTDKISETNSEKSNGEKQKKILFASVFRKGKTNEKTKSVEDLSAGFRPISWTEESKKHAFELLRLMNNVEEQTECNIHTML